jgi:hypothetical protein
MTLIKFTSGGGNGNSAFERLKILTSNSLFGGGTSRAISFGTANNFYAIPFAQIFESPKYDADLFEIDTNGLWIAKTSFLCDIKLNVHFANASTTCSTHAGCVKVDSFPTFPEPYITSQSKYDISGNTFTYNWVYTDVSILEGTTPAMIKGQTGTFNFTFYNPSNGLYPYSYANLEIFLKALNNY